MVDDEISAEDAAHARESMPPPGGSALPADFVTFVLSLRASGLMHLGEISLPGVEKRDINLPLVRQTIDLLGMLEEKTRGNLSGEEERILTQTLFDLRMRYVAAAGGTSQASG